MQACHSMQQLHLLLWMQPSVSKAGPSPGDLIQVMDRVSWDKGPVLSM